MAEAIASRLDVKDVFDVATITKGQVEPYDVLILGTSTWGDGELQDDWNDGINVIKSVNLAGKDVALFGCGDSMAYSDTFCNGMHLLKEELGWKAPAAISLAASRPTAIPTPTPLPSKKENSSVRP